MWGRRGWTMGCAVGLVLAITPGCGTRVSGSSTSSPDPHTVPSAPVPGADGSAADQPRAVPETPDPTGPAQAAGAAGPSSSGRSDARTKATGNALPQAPTRRDAPGPSITNDPSQPPRGGPATGASPGTPTTPSVPAGTAEKKPIIIGNVGTWSGPLGAAFAGAVVGSQMWARTINDRGGIDGHPVKILSLDDAGDPARSKANVKELIEKRGAVALMADYSVLTRSGHSDYILEKRIPVIAGEQGTPEWRDNAMYFRAGANGMVLVYGAVYEAAQRGKKKLAFIYCVEIADCKRASLIGGQAAQEHGMSMVYSAGVSVGQPDYTAECLQAQRAGADTVYVLADPNSVGRFAKSCDRQGYRPLYIAASSGIDASLATVQGIQGGMVSTQPQPPWFLKMETPAITAYAEAKRRYAAGSKEGQDVMVGWVAGKMIEKALANVSPLGTAVQPADFLRGLWMFKAETVGGLIPPTTFVQDQPTTDEGNCWYPGSVVNGKWTAPQGAQPTCIPMKLKY